MNNRITRQEVIALRKKLSLLTPGLLEFEDRLRSEGFPSTAIETHELVYKLTRLALILDDIASILPTEKEVNDVC